jgi:hypothetical protein
MQFFLTDKVIQEEGFMTNRHNIIQKQFSIGIAHVGSRGRPLVKIFHEITRTVKRLIIIIVITL